MSDTRGEIIWWSKCDLVEFMSVASFKLIFLSIVVFGYLVSLSEHQPIKKGHCTTHHGILCVRDELNIIVNEAKEIVRKTWIIEKHVSMVPMFWYCEKDQNCRVLDSGHTNNRQTLSDCGDGSEQHSVQSAIVGMACSLPCTAQHRQSELMRTVNRSDMIVNDVFLENTDKSVVGSTQCHASLGELDRRSAQFERCAWKGGR